MTLTELLNGPWVQSLGWALIHSLWQGAAIMLLLLTVLKFIPIKRSEARYSLSYAAIFLQLITSVSTYIYLLPLAQDSARQLSLTPIAGEQITNGTVSVPFITSVVLFFQMNMNIWISLWFMGTMIFIARIIIGWFYLSQLRRDSISIGDDWNKIVLDLSYRLGIKQYVSISESDKISVPIVIGFFKPLILLPIGMLSGLSAEQVETILIHELMHVRRNDYLFNLVQSFIEAIFFFNPFVWIISNIIRTEREHCCDDAVVRFHGDAVTYVHALSRLEEVSLTKPTLALSLAKNKHYLLNRIKRLMEKSIVKYPVREKMLPLVVLIVGLMCASWITIKSSQEKKDESPKSETIQTDTTKKPKAEKSAKYSRKSVTIIDEKGEPIEKVTEEFEGDESLRPFVTIPEVPEIHDIEAFAFVPNIPDFDMMPPMPDMDQFNFNYSFNSSFDTLNPGMDNFSAEFEKMFSERFGDFYKTHEEEINKMMEDLNEKMQDGRFEGLNFQKNIQFFKRTNNSQKQIEEQVAQIEKINMQQHKVQMQKMEEQMHKMHKDQEQNMERLNEKMREMEKNMQAFEGELHNQLVKDGYLKKDEKIKNLHFNQDGDIEINGTKIKEKDKPKYKAIQDKFHQEKKGDLRIVE